MPYRRLPNTDNARLRALKSAFIPGEKLPPFKLAYSQNSLQRLRHFLPEFENTIARQREAFRTQVKNNGEYISVTRKARLYISHFFQVLNLAIMRGELPASTRKYFDIKETDKKVPPLMNEDEIIFWGKKVISGEKDRISKGLNPVTNPTFGIVSVRYEKFIEAYWSQKNLQNTNSKVLTKITQQRKEADEIILTVWNEVESFFSYLPENEKRERSSEYGLVYVFRTNEKEGQNELFDEDSTVIISENEIISQNNLTEERQNILINNTNLKQSEEDKSELQYSLYFNKD